MFRISMILVFLALASARADTLQGTVTGIADGDTLYVTDMDSREYKVRLQGIDAPEHDQAFGEASSQSLRQLTYRKTVQIEWYKHDAYGRVLGKVVLTESNLDSALHQVSSGLAWWNRKYAHEQTDTDAIRYREAEYVARKKRLGLWSQQNPVPPWRWRYANRPQTDTVKP
jgi:endonuclease YncB( thermonuclease family)